MAYPSWPCWPNRVKLNYLHPRYAAFIATSSSTAFGHSSVRTVPKSRTFPWFGTDRMAQALPQANIRYEHLAALGGFRSKHKDSPNTGWQNQSFRGYADYTLTDAFQQGIDQLNQRLQRGRVCVMCSEAVWWRCHRRLIADAETARGIPVRHIMNEKDAPLHQHTAFARVEPRENGPPRITYPQPAPQ